MKAIEKTVLLACDVERAFTLFTARASLWWPAGRRHTPDPSSEIRMLESGRFWERASDGQEVELGRVRRWRRPHELVLDFYVGTDAAHPTEVTITFVPEGEGTRITVVHRPLPESVEPWTQRAPAFERSWTLLLESLALYAR